MKDEVIKKETICETEIKLVRIKTESYQLSEYNLERLYEDDIAVLIPLLSNTGPKKYRQFVVEELNMFDSLDTIREANEYSKSDRCAICENKVSKNQRQSIIGVHSFIFHDTCFKKFCEIAGKSLEEFNTYLSAGKL